MTEGEIHQLIEKYIAGHCSPEEEDMLERWYAGELGQRLAEMDQSKREDVKEDIWEGIVAQRQQLAKRRVSLRVWAAAAAILLVGSFIAIYQSRQAQYADVGHDKIARRHTEVLPGGNKAILTTGDGKRIVLTDEQDGVIDEGEGFVIRKQEDGLVSFEIADSPDESVLAKNTIETPRGGIYRVVLPDGSKAWLNSASTISFPSNFSKDERRVAITGEVYFEVQRDVSRPFRVDAPQQQVEVLGTKFNINAYADEPHVRTSLLEGSVKVKGASKEHVLKPGFEMMTDINGKDRVEKADMDAIMAWKEGIFQFEQVELSVLMRQLARWYDVEVVYTGDYPKDEFVGKIKREEDIQKVLNVLKYGNVDVSLEGRKLMVGRKN